MLFGAFIGTISTLYIYPLDTDLYGTLQFLIAAVGLLLPFAGIGVQALTVRFFPEFNQGSKSNHGFLGLLYLLLAIGIFIFSVLTFFLQEPFYALLRMINMDDAIFRNNFTSIFVLLCITLFVERTHQFLTNYQRVFVPYILYEFWLKIFIPAFVLLSVFQGVSHELIKWLFIACKLGSLLGLLYYTYLLGALQLKVDWSFLNKERIKIMANYSMVGIIGSIGSVLAFQVDKVMVTGFEGVTSNAIYSIALFIANVIIIPSQSIIPLASAQISRFSNKGEQEKIQDLYAKSSITMLIIGLGMFLVIWWNIDDIFSLTPKKDTLMLGKMVVLYLGIARLIDMITGVNNQIIAFSKYYRWNLLFVFLMGVLTVTSNLYFIPRLGITGAAVATFISLTLFNLLKYSFIWYVFNMQPFGRSTLYVLLLGALASVVAWAIPETPWLLVNIAFRTLLISGLFFLPIYYFRISEDISDTIDRLVRRGRSFLK